MNRNPRELFPVRDDFIRSAWVRRARTERAQEYEELYPYFRNRSAPADPCEASTSAAAAAAAVSTTAATRVAIPQTAPETTAASTLSQQHHQHQQEQGAPSTKDPSKKGPIAAAAVAAAAAAATTSPTVSKRDDNGGRPRSHRRLHMGVGTGPRNVAELRRAFRRLEPEHMFRAPRVEGEPIWAYWGAGRGEGTDHSRGQGQPPLPPGKRASTKDGFVLVPAKDLEELRALEGSLRKERSVLKAHCLVALSEGEVCVCVCVCVIGCVCSVSVL